MSQEFLARILEQKAREVEQMELEEVQPCLLYTSRCV